MNNFNRFQQQQQPYYSSQYNPLQISSIPSSRISRNPHSSSNNIGNTVGNNGTGNGYPNREMVKSKQNQNVFHNYHNNNDLNYENSMGLSSIDNNTHILNNVNNHYKYIHSSYLSTATSSHSNSSSYIVSEEEIDMEDNNIKKNTSNVSVDDSGGINDHLLLLRLHQQASPPFVVAAAAANAPPSPPLHQQSSINNNNNNNNMEVIPSNSSVSSQEGRKTFIVKPEFIVPFQQPLSSSSSITTTKAQAVKTTGATGKASKEEEDQETQLKMLMMSADDRANTYTKLISMVCNDETGVIKTLTKYILACDYDGFVKALVNLTSRNTGLINVINAVTEAEFEVNRERPGDILRGHSIAAKLHTIYATSIGNNYRIGLLSNEMGRIVVDDGHKSFELDILRLQEGESLQGNKENLVSALNRLINVFCSPAAVNQAPLYMRMIANVIYNLSVKYVEESHVLPMVGGFLFLRFFNPAITMPEQHGLLPTGTILTSRNRRNLILVSKVLQAMANGVIFGEKEEYMTVMNHHMIDNKRRFNAFVYDFAHPKQFNNNNNNNNMIINNNNDNNNNNNNMKFSRQDEADLVRFQQALWWYRKPIQQTIGFECHPIFDELEKIHELIVASGDENYINLFSQQQQQIMPASAYNIGGLKTIQRFVFFNPSIQTGGAPTWQMASFYDVRNKNLLHSTNSNSNSNSNSKSNSNSNSSLPKVTISETTPLIIPSTSTSSTSSSSSSATKEKAAEEKKPAAKKKKSSFKSWFSKTKSNWFS